jgi:hypothetical protein
LLLTDCKGHIGTFKRYWWRKALDAPLCIISGTNGHPRRPMDTLFYFLFMGKVRVLINHLAFKIFNLLVRCNEFFLKCENVNLPPYEVLVMLS